MHRLPNAAAPPLIGQAPAFLETLEQASLAAKLDRPVLVVGERGTGKELVAARIHYLSPRWDQDYVKVNCAALTESLLESELFGHEAGAFTGAGKQHIGAFERADGGTLLLDEVGTASLRLQEKILRVVEYGEFERVGGARTLSINVRVIGATNEDLPGKAAAGQFRADLLDRLAFDVITLAPLRVRWEDIPILTEHFGRRMAGELGAPRFAGFALSAMAALLDYGWPGNVRELRNVVERAVYRAVARDASGSIPIETVALDPFASPWRPGAPTRPPAVKTEETSARPTGGGVLSGQVSLPAQVDALERALVSHALLMEEGHQGRAAQRLGLSYHQLRGLLRKQNARNPAPS